MGAALRAVLVLLAASIPTHAAALKSGPDRRGPVERVVIHSTGGPTCDPSTNRPVWIRAGTLDDNLRTIEAHPRLGIHYMIDRDGTRRASVPEHQVAHHVFRHSRNSIAIELINDGDGVDPFSDAQLASLADLLKEIVERQGLGPRSIQRHSDLDTNTMPCDRTRRRKVDPGPAFPLERIVEQVFGVGPSR